MLTMRKVVVMKLIVLGGIMITYFIPMEYAIAANFVANVIWLFKL